jgi:hypothetical protein
MSANRVFFPQQTLDEWLEQGRVTLVDDELTVGPVARRFRLTSALHFMAEVADTEDAHDLVGKVKTMEQVQALSGEHYADSVVLGDNAYQVIEGFLGELLPASAAPVTSKRSARNSLASDRDAYSRLLRQLQPE